jgi:hypothetical protein
VAYAVSIYGNDLSKIRNLAVYLHHPDLKQVLGRAGQNLVRDNLYSFDRMHPNKLGGKRTHFYGQAARGTSYTVDPTVITISVNQVGIRQAWLGGTITAGVNEARYSGKPTKYLTLPAIAEAHGKRAGEFGNLTMAFGKSGKPYALVEAVATLIKSRKVGISPGVVAKEKKKAVVGGRVYYWLVPSVHQQGTPELMPTQKEFAAALAKASDAFIQRKAWGKS